METYLTRNFEKPEARTLSGYEKLGGFRTARKALGMKPEDVLAQVKAANLRGRGGAGFPAGVKWGFLPDNGRPRYLVVNADEGEPGTFKDRQLMERDPFQLLEGILITCHAIKAKVAYIYVRGELVRAARLLEECIEEMRMKRYLGKHCMGMPIEIDIHVHRGAGAYICGEETALLNSLEGRRGEPRLKPPFPAVAGAFSDPTIVNNVETISNVPHIVERGGEWFAKLGVEGDGGVRIFGVSGHVRRPGLYERPVGYNLRTLIFEDCGGIRGGNQLKAVIPGGSSTPVLLPSEIDVPLSVEGLQKAGTMSGSAAIIVMDETTCTVRAMWRLSRFYHHESCGQCTPCRDGCGWIEAIMERIEHGRGVPGDLETLEKTARGMSGTTICPLADACSMPTLGFLGKFRKEFEEHIEKKACPFGGKFVPPWEVE
jgi:NADH-quinone oxidoreductase subunit F